MFRITSYLFLIFAVFLLIPGCYSKKIFNLHDLPVPNGPYTVGTIQFDWINKNYDNLFEDNLNEKRRIMVQFWYPGIFDETQERYLYSNDSIVTEALSKE